MNTRMIRAAAMACVAIALVSRSQAADLSLPKEGWASWEVDAVDGARAWCCWKTWEERNTSAGSCNLDDNSNGHTVRDSATTDKMRVYARLTGGKVERLRVLSASCPVETKTPIQTIATTTDDSARWLIAKSKSGELSGGDLRENAMAALAVHRGDLAHKELVSTARGDASIGTREKAVFWLALMRGTAGADVVTDLMFNDAHADLRKHAAFAITQSKSPKIAESLIRLGNTDKDADVRGQAWFWLAHTGAENAESAIGAAMKNDESAHVREHAVFALSQLPDERATRALIAAAEDKSLSSEQRKRAVFWLAQSGSRGAQDYLERVLTGNAAR